MTNPYAELSIRERCAWCVWIVMALLTGISSIAFLILLSLTWNMSYVGPYIFTVVWHIGLVTNAPYIARHSSEINEKESR